VKSEWGFKLQFRAGNLNLSSLGAEGAFTMESCKVPTTVVVAEDDEDDRLLIEQAFSSSCQCLKLHFAHDGLELLEYLKNGGVAKPCLILIDLNMPKMGGIEALERIRSDARLKDIPVIVLTTSDEEDSVVTTYCKGANSYIRKPMLFSELEHIVDIIGKYWCQIVLLPSKGECQT
jgi:two-component system, response regulator